MTGSPTKTDESQVIAAIEQQMDQLIIQDRVKLWAYPDVAVKLGEVIGRENASMAQVTRIVSADPTLAGAVLRLANSATHSRGGAEIRALADAVTRIGLQGIHHVALAAGLGREVCGPGPLKDLRFLVWRWSVASRSD